MAKRMQVIVPFFAMWLLGCMEGKHESPQTIPTQKQNTQSSGKDATDVTKATATQLAKETREAVKSTVESVRTHAVATLQKAQEEISKVVVAQTPGNAGKYIYQRECSHCHGKDGKKQALGKSVLLAGQRASILADKLKAYQSGDRNVTGLGKTMQLQVASLSTSDLLAVAEYISTLK